MAIDRSSITPTNDDGTGTTGTILNAAYWALLLDAIDALAGTWASVSFAAGNFTANNSMTWTVASGDVTRNRYKIIDKTLFWQAMIATTTVGGTPSTELRIAIPSGTFASISQVFAVAYANDNGTVREAYAEPSSTSVLAFKRKDAGNWTASTDATYLYFSIVAELA